MRRKSAVALLVLLAACGGDGPEVSQEEPPPEVTGLITEVQRSGDAVSGFTLDANGTTYQVSIDPERDYGFDLDHLDEHVAQRDPVRVRLEARAGTVYAVSIDDA